MSKTKTNNKAQDEIPSCGGTDFDHEPTFKLGDQRVVGEPNRKEAVC
jgi:hypothetical protein